MVKRLSGLFGAALLAASISSVSVAAPRKAAASASNAKTLARIKATMAALGGRFRDMDTLADLVVTPPKGSGDAKQNRQMAMTAHLYIKMPDKVKFEVLNSTFPLFNRWIFLQAGNEFAAYDPVSDRRVTTDFKRLTGRDPARVDTSMAMLGLLFDPSRYRFEFLGKTKRKGIPVYHVRLHLLHPEQISPISRVLYTDMYMDTQHFAPVYSESYDTAGRLASTGDFSSLHKTPAGWAPLRIKITDHEIDRYRRDHHLEERARRKLAKKLGRPLPKEDPPQPLLPGGTDRHRRILRNGTLDLWIGWQGNVLYPWKMFAIGPDGGTSQWTFRDTKVNTGLSNGIFKI